VVCVGQRGSEFKLNMTRCGNPDILLTHRSSVQWWSSGNLKPRKKLSRLQTTPHMDLALGFIPVLTGPFSRLHHTDRFAP
jgi:hypothetical protein